MYQEHGWWFPDYDTHFARMLTKNIKRGGGAVYQEPVRSKSFEFVQHKGLALDIGANVGLWSRDMAEQFDKVIAFEPVNDFRECYKKNVAMTKVDMRSHALGNETTKINMIITPENTGHSHVDVNSMGDGTIDMFRLDDLDLPKFDYCKIDCEGYEENILLGGIETFKKYKPIMVIEQKGHDDVGFDYDYEALGHLTRWGAQELCRVRNDIVMGWV